MSSLAAAVAAAPARAPHSRPQRRGAAPLRLVEPVLTAPRRIPTRVLALLIGLLGLVAILVSNIIVSSTTYTVASLTAEQQALHEERDRLVEDISYRESPQNLAAQAEALGLVRDTDPTYLDLATGELTTVGAHGQAESSHTKIPGPRADARDAVRPNLRSDEKLPVVGGSDRDFTVPSQKVPAATP